MSSIKRRIEALEKQLGFDEKPHPVIIAGIEMSSDEFAELLKIIDGTSKGVLPCQEEISEYQALCAGDTEI